MANKKILNNLIEKEVVVNGEAILILKCVEPEYQPKKKHKVKKYYKTIKNTFK